MQPQVDSSRPEDRRSDERQSSSDRRFWHPTPGQITDVSATGMAVQTKMRLEVGRTYTFKARFGSTLLQIPAIVRWSRLEISKLADTGQLAYYQSGLFFPDSLDQSASAFLMGQTPDELA